MKGQILDYSVKENAGVITGVDGARYTFAGSEWKADVQPSRGMSVDFDTKDTNAISIYKALGSTINFSSSGQKKRVTAGILALLLGGAGVHKFYLGAWGLGIIYFIFFWTWIPAFLGLAEGVRYLTLSDEEFNSKVSQMNGPLAFLW